MAASADLPSPSPDALAVSAELTRVIRDEIRAAGGWLDFARYMQLALYAPGLGYYSAGSTKLGPSGDFVTAPELSGVLGRALARTLRAELAETAEAVDYAEIGSPVILELGAGSGALAAQILDALADLNPRYLILEPSADLREKQERALARFAGRVSWLDRLPERPNVHAVVANEVLDALPVSRFAKRGARVVPRGVIERGDGFAWADGPEHAVLAAAVEALEQALGGSLPDGYESEVVLQLPVWIAGVAGTLANGGCMLLVDYGLVRREYYHPQRSGGTLICHYRHRAHADPFLLPGLQDLSAWVDFSACADAARAAGLEVGGFTTQAQFLLTTLATEPPRADTDAAAVRERSALKTLLLPGEMGERFKVLLLRKGAASDPPTAALPGRDLRGWL
jgi:SAM-dependent MidA family methyltransferase